jgi:hypothetical protein
MNFRKPLFATALAPKMMPYYQAAGARPTYPVGMGPAGV